jgi:hypothetical protein
MAVWAYVVGGIGAVTGVLSLGWQIRTWKQAGWRLDVDAYWDKRRQEIVVEITNTGRTRCVISEIRYFLKDLSPQPAKGPDRVLFDKEQRPIDPSVRTEVARPLPQVPLSFSYEVWAWTGKKAYKSRREYVADSADRPLPLPSQAVNDQPESGIPPTESS